MDKFTSFTLNPNDWGYSSCIHKFEHYFSFANRDNRIKDILDNALKELSSIQHQNDTGEEILPPNNFLIPGAPQTKPRNNESRLHGKIKTSGAPRTKRQYTYSICRLSGHTAPRCRCNTDISFFH